MASADVTSESHRYAGIEESADGCKPRCEVEVRRGTVGNHDLSLAQEFQLFVVGPYAMCHHGGRLSEQSVAVVCIGIVLALGFELPNPCYLVEVLREV